MWFAHEEGAEYVKLFPAQLWRPEVLKAMLGTGSLGDVKIIPSGGISGDTAQAWFDAGATAVGMGSKLCGQDIKIDPREADQQRAARAQWSATGRANAAAILKRFAGAGGAGAAS